MLIRPLRDCDEFIAGDDSILREILHAGKADLAIRYSLAHAKVQVGGRTRLHRLRTSEVYYILEGTGCMHIDGEKRQVTAGDTVYIPPHCSQRIENTGTTELTFLCIVDPAWRQADEEVLEER